MTVFKYKYPSADLPPAARAIALGFFDGVHIGHRALFAECVSLSRAEGLVPTVLTFPAEAMKIKSGAARIYSTEEKLRLFEECGILQTIIVDFDSISGLSPEDFVTRVLVSDLGAKIALAGENFRFGHRATGDAALLSELMPRSGGRAYMQKMKECSLPSRESVNVSSTLIRDYLGDGEIEIANLLLGSPYRIREEVVRGNGVGSSLGFPTVNTAVPDHTPLALGVYRTEIHVGKESYPALTNVGTCPTFTERRVHAETFIPQFSGNLYGKTVEIRFLEFIRKERAFASAEELKREVERNINYVMKGK